MTDFINSNNIQNVAFELRQVTLLTSGTEKTLRMASETSSDHRLALSRRMEQQYQNLSRRLDVISEAINNKELPQSSAINETLSMSEKERDSQALRILTSHRIPCRAWCPCACHMKSKMNSLMPRVMDVVLGKIFVGYSGLPVLNNACDFKKCRDRQDGSATVEYWFPWWFASINLKLHLTCRPLSGPQLHLSTTRRISDDSQSISFALQGNIDGLKDLFSQRLAGPRDVSHSRGYTLMRVSVVRIFGMLVR